MLAGQPLNTEQIVRSDGTLRSRSQRTIRAGRRMTLHYPTNQVALGGVEQKGELP